MLRALRPTNREQRSLFVEILDWMLAPLLLVWPLSMALTWVMAQGIANKPHDRDLGALAYALARRVQSEPPERRTLAPAALPQGLIEILHGDDDDSVYFQVLGARGEFVMGDWELPVPNETPTAPGVLRLRDDEVQGRPVRVAYLWLSEGARPGEAALVQVAETLDKRSRLATEITKGVIFSQFVILPIAVLLVWMALARGLQPLDRLQRRIRQRESHDLSPISERDAPEEVAPLVGAINDLLARLDRSIGAQKHFIADAAHQLRTPLAGLRMQAELAQRELDAGGDAQAVKRSLQQIARSSQRATHMVNQLLALARADDKELARHVQELNLTRLAMDAVRDFVPRALELGIDLGFEGPEAAGGEGTARAVRMVGHPVLVRELIRNLIDNALNYTPRGGSVTARVLADPFGQVAVLQVEDTGPGIPEAERELVFRAFYRSLGTNVDGSGLGLAIVREIAQQHRAEVRLEDAQPRATPPGARFTVRFPAAAAVA